MKKITKRSVLAAFLIVSFSFTGGALGNPLVNFQGILQNDGQLVNGQHNFTFKIFTSLTGGNPVWTESYSNVPVNQGVYNVQLGTVQSLAGLNFDQNTYWMEVTVESEVLSPRQQITYNLATLWSSQAQHAVHADTASVSTIPDGSITTPKLADNAVTSAKILDGTITASDLNFQPVIAPVQTNQIANNAITNAKMANGSVGSTEIIDGSITAADLAFTPATLPIQTSGIADGAVTSAKIANNAINSSQIIDGSVSLNDLASNSVNSAKVVDGSITAADLAFTPATLPIQTSGIADSAVTTSKIANGAITNAKIHANAVGTTEIADGAITTAKVAANAITNAKMANNSVGSTEIIDGSITTTDLAFTPATLPIQTSGIADGAVTSAKIANNAVNSSQIIDGSVSLNDLAGNSVNSSKIVDGSITAADLAFTPATLPIQTSGIADSAVTTVKIADNAVTNAKLHANAVGTTEIADGAVTTVKVAGNAITNAKMANNSVGSAEIIDGSITTTDLAFTPATLPIQTDGIADAAITTPKIVENAVTNGKIAPNSIVSAHIVDGAIWTNDLADNSITAAKMTYGAITLNALADNSVSSTKIVNGTIQPEDMGFTCGTITAVNAGNGLEGGGASGPVTLSVSPTLNIGSGVQWSLTGNANNMFNITSTGLGTILNLNSSTTNQYASLMESYTNHGRAGYFYKGADDGNDVYCVDAVSPSSSSSGRGLYVFGCGVATAGFGTSFRTSEGRNVDLPAICSDKRLIHLCGTGTLAAGRAVINFDRTTIEMLSDAEPLRIILTPKHGWSGLYVENSSKNGFTVATGAGDNSLSFDWLATGVLKEQNLNRNAMESAEARTAEPQLTGHH